MLPLIVVDAANVVGSVPDGWWRDRAGAAQRLRDALAPFSTVGLPARNGTPDWATHGPVRVVLVVEGAARHLPSTADVEVVSASRSGDDAIVDLVRAELTGSEPAGSDPVPRCPVPHCLVATADRELRERVRRLGAEVIGPRGVYRG